MVNTNTGKQSVFRKGEKKFDGAASGIRTHDILNHNLKQLFCVVRLTSLDSFFIAFNFPVVQLSTDDVAHIWRTILPRKSLAS